MASPNEDLDHVMLALINTLTEYAQSNARNGVGQILTASSNYLSSKMHEGLKEFHNLYFGGATLNQKKEDINDDVTRIFEEAEQLLAEGKSEAEMNDAIVDDGMLTKDRLSISALQKQLETLINFEEGFREKLTPVLASLQFEDAMTQRMQHIEAAWVNTVAALHANGDFAAIAEQIAKSLSSDEERRSFYSLVLRETPPEGLDDRSIWVDFSA